MITITDLTKRFSRTTVLDGLSLTVGAGESVALWGSNGAGKTTLLRCLAGLYDYAGTVAVGGIDARRDGKRARQLMGYVPQETGVPDDLRLADALAFFARLRGVGVEAPSELLARVGLAGQDRKRVRECSGGMKQRLALAVALLGEPPVLLLDEVTASLDAAGRASLVALLGTLARSPERAVLFASHRVEEIAALATRVVVLEQGKVKDDLPVSRFVEFYAPESATHTLHLLMDLPASRAAIDVLARRGIAARLNGHGILVDVAPGARMDPIRILHDERLAISDFELLSPASAKGGAR